MDDPAIPVTVVTGFLGAGKTTLLDRWLAAYARDEVAVIVNEVGAQGVDGELLAARARTILELTGGCVCCTTQAELVRALAALADRAPPPARIFVETSGVASPAGVVRAVTRNPAADRLRLDGVVTVVDPTRLARVARSAVAAEQVGFADVLALSRADACPPEVLDEAAAALAARNPTAVVARVARGAVVDPPAADLDALLARRGDDLRVYAPPPATAHDAGIEAVALSLDGALDEARFMDWVESEVARFEGRLLRLKGVVAVEGVDARVVLQGVADQVEVTVGAPWGDDARASRVVLIGFGLDAAGLRAGFRACAAR